MKRELSRWSQFEFLRTSLPADTVPPAEMADRIVVLLGEHGLIGDGLFAHISAIRPYQRAPIAAVATAYAAAAPMVARPSAAAGKQSWSRRRAGAMLLLALLAVGTALSIRWMVKSDGESPAHELGERVTPAAPTQPLPMATGDRGTRPDRLELTLRGVKLDSGTVTPGLLSGDRLRSGDLFAFYIAANQPVYLYVIQYFADGARRVLFPEEGDVRLDPNTEARVPANDAWFRLDDAVGTENLYFVTSPKPLEGAAPELASIVRQIRISPGSNGDASPVVDTAPSPPGDRMFLQLRAKGVHTMQVRNGVPVQQASFELHGTGVVHFQIDHR